MKDGVAAFVCEQRPFAFCRGPFGEGDAARRDPETRPGDHFGDDRAGGGGEPQQGAGQGGEQKSDCRATARRDGQRQQVGHERLIGTAGGFP